MEQTRDVENKLFKDLIPNCNENLVKQIHFDSQYRRDEMESYMPSHDDRIIQIASLKDDVCFRIRFRLPVSLLIPKETQLLSGIQRSYKTFPIAFVAAYMPNLNHFTLLRLHGKHTKDYFPDSENLLRNDVCKKFIFTKGIPMEFSSLNFLELQNTQQQNLNHNDINIISKCFEFSFWNVPTTDLQRDHSVIHNFIYNNNEKITAICKTFKTIIKIENIGQNKRTMRFIHHDICYFEANVRILITDDRSFSSKKTRIFIAEHCASKISEGDVVNCLLAAQIKCRKEMPPRIIMIGIVGRIMKQPDLRHLISIVFWQTNRNLSLTSKMCEFFNVEDLKSEIKNLVRKNPYLFESSWINDLDENLRTALQRLDPCFLHCNDVVYSLPPVILNYLITNDLEILEKSTDDMLREKLLEKLAQMMNTIEPKGGSFNNRKKMSLRNSDFIHELQKSGNKKSEEFLCHIPRLSNRIVYSRIISQPSSI